VGVRPLAEDVSRLRNLRDLSVLANVLILLAAGLASGYLGGLLGIGGGLLVVAALSLVLPTLGFPPSQIMHVAVATSMAAIVITLASSSLAHFRRGSVLRASWMRLAPGMAIGALVGAQAAEWLPEQALRGLVAAYCGVMAWRMARGAAGTTPEGEHETEPRSRWLFAAGAGIGTLSAVVGIGGGSMTVPLLVNLGARPVKAVGTSAFAGLVLAVAGTAGYMLATHLPAHPLPEGSVGDVYLPAALVTAVGSMIAAPLGVRTAHSLPSQTLKRVFAVFLVVVGVLIVSGA
jgi:uncharacterized membrane protein YfcA